MPPSSPMSNGNLSQTQLCHNSLWPSELSSCSCSATSCCIRSTSESEQAAGVTNSALYSHRLGSSTLLRRSSEPHDTITYSQAACCSSGVLHHSTDNCLRLCHYAQKPIGRDQCIRSDKIGCCSVRGLDKSHQQLQPCVPGTAGAKLSIACSPHRDAPGRPLPAGGASLELHGAVIVFPATPVAQAGGGAALLLPCTPIRANLICILVHRGLHNMTWRRYQGGGGGGWFTCKGVS